MNNLEKAIADAVYGDIPDGPGPIEVAAWAAREWFVNTYNASDGDFDYVIFASKQGAE